MPDINFTVYVLDSDSPDGTVAAARTAAKKIKLKNFRVKPLRVAKGGLAQAYIDGLGTVLKYAHDHVILIDADLSHHPKYIKDLVKRARAGSDFVTASRYMKGGGISDWGLHRRILSLGANIYTRAVLGNQISDYTNGLNMLSTKLLKDVNLKSLTSVGHGFFIEFKYRAAQKARNFSQIPFMLTDRQHGKSKIPKRTILTNFLLVPRLRFSNREQK